MGYLANFMVYTLAMIGVIAIALLIFKNSLSFGGAGKSKYIKVHDSISLAPRKTLYIVSAGQEKFLIAGDVNQTTLISKLHMADVISTSPTENGFSVRQGQSLTRNMERDVTSARVRTTRDGEGIGSFQETMTKLSKPRYMDTSNISIKSSLLSNKSESTYNSVIKNLALKMKG